MARGGYANRNTDAGAWAAIKSLQAAQQSGASGDALVQSMAALLPGFIPIADECPLFSPARTDVTGTTGRGFRKYHNVLVDRVTQIALVFGNIVNHDDDGPNDITVSAAMALEPGGTIKRVMQPTLIKPGDILVTNPVACRYSSTDEMYTQTYVQVAGGATIICSYISGGTIEARDTSNTSTTETIVTGTSWPVNFPHFGYGPIAVLGKAAA